MKLTNKQTCPYCGHEEDEAASNWEEETENYKCSTCKKEYLVNAEYKFLGFKSQRYCEECGLSEEDCYCGEGEEE